MMQSVEMPLWAFVLLLLFAAVTFASHFLFPSVRWFFRRRLERAVARLNERLVRPIEPFKLTRRYDMIQRLIYDPEVAQEVVNYAREHKVPENVGFERVRIYAREIVPSFSAFTYFSLGTRMARLLAKSIYSVWTSPRNEEIVAAIPKESTIVFVMNHRSNMDYVLVTYLAARTSALSYAVGEWARVWPLSRLIRMMGAYFIRRRARGALYRKVLARYVQMAISGGVAQGIFPEGGLSLTGELMPPKLGLLSYITDGKEAQGRDVVFVPVAINYDRVLEDRVLIAAAERGDRRFGARISVVVRFILRKFWQAARGRQERFGTAAVVFGRPLSLQEAAPIGSVEALGEELMERIGEVMPVLTVPLLARALLETAGPMNHNQLCDVVTEAAARYGAYMPQPVIDDIPTSVSEAVNALSRHGVIKAANGGWEAIESEKDVLRFYAGSLAHRLAPVQVVTT